MLQVVAATSSGLVTAVEMPGEAVRFANYVSLAAGVASLGAYAADGLAHGDLIGGMMATLDLMMKSIAIRDELETPAPQQPEPEEPSVGGGGGGPEGELPVPLSYVAPPMAAPAPRAEGEMPFPSPHVPPPNGTPLPELPVTPPEFWVTLGSGGVLVLAC